MFFHCWLHWLILLSFPQLFSQDSRVLELSQAHYRGVPLDSPPGSGSKRRRVEIGWEVLRDHLQPSQSDFDMIPW